MLVLSRKEKETIRIGDQIEIKVISIKGGRIRLGISAPPEISIARSELLNFGTDESADASPPLNIEIDYCPAATSSV